MSSSQDIAGVILAGGLSRRMGGGDKGLLALDGRSMLAHVIERIRPQVGALAINANGDASRFAAFELPVVPDTVEGFAGPLAGVLAGLMWAQRNMPNARWIVTASADAPFVPVDLMERLRASLSGRGNAIAIAQSDGELHPVIGLWPVALAADLEAALRGGVRKVLAWTDKHGTIPVPFDMIRAGPEVIDPFFNANTPDELAEARRLLALIPSVGS
jgi:molybdopterin-guanine dinucleotide biosynthesis protein A